MYINYKFGIKEQAVLTEEDIKNFTYNNLYRNFFGIGRFSKIWGYPAYITLLTQRLLIIVKINAAFSLRNPVQLKNANKMKGHFI